MLIRVLDMQMQIEASTTGWHNIQASIQQAGLWFAGSVYSHQCAKHAGTSGSSDSRSVKVILTSLAQRMHHLLVRILGCVLRLVSPACCVDRFLWDDFGCCVDRFLLSGVGEDVLVLARSPRYSVQFVRPSIIQSVPVFSVSRLWSLLSGSCVIPRKTDPS